MTPPAESRRMHADAPGGVVRLALLTAWDAMTGKLLWKKESAKDSNPSFPSFGAAGSPLVWEETCFVHLGGHQRDKTGNPDAGAIVALGVSDGPSWVVRPLRARREVSLFTSSPVIATWLRRHILKYPW